MTLRMMLIWFDGGKKKLGHAVVKFALDFVFTRRASLEFSIQSRNAKYCSV
jgi:hypothetical protein